MKEIVDLLDYLLIEQHYLVVSIRRYGYGGVLILHVDGEASDLRQGVREIPKIGQQIDNRVSYLHKNALSMSGRYNRARIIPKKTVRITKRLNNEKRYLYSAPSLNTSLRGNNLAHGVSHR